MLVEKSVSLADYKLEGVQALCLPHVQSASSFNTGIIV